MPRKNKRTISIASTKVAELGKSVIAKPLTDDCLWYQSEHLGKELSSDFRVQTKEGIIQHIFFHANGTAHVIADIPLKVLENLVKEAKKRKRYFQKRDYERKKKKLRRFSAFFSHINPEISILVRYR